MAAERRSPILSSARNGETEEVRAILAQDPSVIHSTDKNGWTALHYGASKNRVETVIELLNSGARVDAVENTAKWTCVHVACYVGAFDVLQYLISYIKETQPENLQTLVDMSDQHGSTPLILAALKGKQDMVRLLLATQCVSVEAQTDRGDTVLKVAKKHPEVEALILDALDGKFPEVEDVTLTPAVPAEDIVETTAQNVDSDDEGDAADGDNNNADTAANGGGSNSLAPGGEMDKRAKRTSRNIESLTDFTAPAEPAGGGGESAGKGVNGGGAAAAEPAAPAGSGVSGGSGGASGGGDGDESAMGKARAAAAARNKEKLEAERIAAEEGLVSFMEVGSWLLKHTKDGTGPVHRRYFKMDTSGNLFWGRNADCKKWKNAYVEEVVPLVRPEKFTRSLEIFHNKDLWKSTSFCLNTTIGPIHLVAETIDLYKVWVAGAEIIVARATNRDYDLQSKIVA